MQGIHQWLELYGLAHHAALFERNGIDLDILRELTDDDLLLLGVSLGDRKRLARALRDSSPDVAVGANADSRGTPKDFTPVIESLTAEGERRQVTVLFCDLVGSTTLASSHDPEEYRSKLNQYYGICSAQVRRFDGYIAQIQGDGVVAYFGYPIAHEGEAERAVRAGLSIAAAFSKSIDDQSLSLQVRVGIASGSVVVSHILARDKSAVGETPNLAARLQSLASPGQVLVDGRTRLLIGGSHEFADLGEHSVKGLPGTVRVWRALGPSDASSRFEAATRGGLTPLVGREYESALLANRWEMTLAGKGQVVTLQGEPGIGKSRMLQTLRERLRTPAHIALQYQCSPYYSNSVLYPIADHLMRALQFVEEESNSSKLDKIEGYLRDVPRASTRQRSKRDAKRVALECRLLAQLLGVECDTRYGPLQMSPQR
jgi:class 3 adenylate cyclase